MNRSQTVYDVLAELEADGRLTAAQLVAVAKRKTHALHAEFEWDDTKAAHQNRIDRARTLIRSVRIMRVEGVTVVREIAYVRDQSVPHNRQGYISIPRLRKTDEKSNAREAVLYEFARASAALERARQVAACLGLEAQIDRLSTSLRKLVKRTGADQPRQPSA